MRRPILFLFLLLNTLFSRAQTKEAFNYYFSHITGENGLSQSNVKAILQDSYGFMWFGTKNGLNRYDGSSIVILDCNDPATGRSNQNVTTLFESADRLLWVGTDEGVFIYDPVSEKFSFLGIETENGMQMTNWVSAIEEDHNGNIWIVIPTQGLFRYKENTLYHYYITDPAHYENENPECMCICKNGEVWIGANHQGLYLYNEDADTFTQYVTDKNGNGVKDENIYAICEYGDYIVVAIHEGELKKFHRYSREFTVINAPGVHYTVLRDVVCFDEKELWVGTQAGLFIINEERNKVVHVQEEILRPDGLSDKAIYCIYKDRQNGIWLGTHFGGVNYLSDRKMIFEKYIPLNSSASLTSKRIRQMAEDAEGRIWIGTEDGGLNRLDPESGTVRQIGREESVRNNWLNTLTVFIDGNEIWCGLFKKGLNLIDRTGNNMAHFSGKELNLDEESIYALCKDRTGRIWLGNAWGVAVRNPGEKEFQKFDRIKPCWIFDIMEASDGKIWIVSMGTGVYSYNPQTEELRHYQHEPDNPASLSTNTVSNIMEDSRGYLWFSTDRGGICRYDPEKDTFTTYSVEDGLPDNVAYTILEDEQSNLWFGTNRGLVKFNPDTKAVRIFTKSDGLLGNQFNYKSALKARDGKFYFGGIDGLISFYPGQERNDDFIPPVYITRMRLFNEDVTSATPYSPLDRSILFTKEIKLPYDKAHVSFDFVSLNYSGTESNQYIYKMEPMDKAWIKAEGKPTVSYSKLLPGDYLFRVKVINPDAKWKENETSIKLIILPPWWKTTWAYILYILFSVLFIVGMFIWYKRRKDKKLEEARKLYEIEKEKELYSAKVEFFTEIAHEVKTPLTLINGPLENIMEMDIRDEKVLKNLRVISSNTNRLLELTKQLLDFRKVDANKFLMNFVMADIPKLVHDILLRFEPTFTKVKKELLVDLPEESFPAAIDKEGVTKIISNLLNNALKYSATRVYVNLYKEETTFSLQVESDGEKIPLEFSRKIFEPFYQLKRDQKSMGAGMGLALARSLAALHNGRLYLDVDREYNSFVLTLPLNQEKIIHPEDHSVKDEYIRPEEINIENSIPSGYTILLVEDNESIQSFLKEELQRSFIVKTASNGLEALDALKTEPVDVILSDIRMPGMDGMEFCRIVKSDVTYSHIPFIFLTAKDDLNSKIDGLKAGAEAYLEKPFSFNHLKTQLFSLLENRRKEREAFSKRPFFPVHNMHMNRADEEFMEDVIKIIRDNITDPQFNVERLAEIMSMSRSNLLRKIKMLSDLSPVEFINLIRLKTAAELILEGNHRIGEIGYKVGINSPSYFSKLFQKQFGMTPKEFEKENRLHREML